MLAGCMTTLWRETERDIVISTSCSSILYTWETFSHTTQLVKKPYRLCICSSLCLRRLQRNQSSMHSLDMYYHDVFVCFISVFYAALHFSLLKGTILQGTSPCCISLFRNTLIWLLEAFEVLLARCELVASRPSWPISCQRDCKCVWVSGSSPFNPFC
jgi:hypothetical protein